MRTASPPSQTTTATSSPVAVPSSAAPRPAAEVVPASARAVTIFYQPGLTNSGNPPSGSPGPGLVTISTPAVVSGLAAIINALPSVTPGVTHCPTDSGGLLNLLFRASPGAEPLAKVTVDPTGCQQVILTLGTPQQPALQGSSALVTQLLHTAGLNWHLG